MAGLADIRRCIALDLLAHGSTEIEPGTQVVFAAADAAGADSLWPRYLSGWTRWNPVRTVASLLSSALFIVALCRVD